MWERDESIQENENSDAIWNMREKKEHEGMEGWRKVLRRSNNFCFVLTNKKTLEKLVVYN